MVVPPGGNKAVGYTRCTTYVGCLEDTFNLSKWQQRQVAAGLALRPDLVALASQARGDKSTLNNVCEQAHEAAASSAAANTGTAIHGLAEMLDTGLTTLAEVPADYRPDLAAYLEATAGWKHLHVETFMVRDDLRVGGTPDRISVLPDGRRVIADIKTGSVDYGMGKIAMQLAMYANSVIYDTDTQMRHPVNVDLTTAVVIHVPAGSGTARLIEVDITAGWQAVDLARQVRAWRSRKDLARDLDPSPAPAPAAAPTHADVILAEIAACDTVDALEGVYYDRIALWGDVHTAAAADRKQALGGVA